MAALLFVHERLAISAVLYLLVCVVWGFVSYARGRGPSGGYLGALAIGAGLLLVQAGLGVALVLAGLTPHTWLHAVYGSLGFLSLPAAYVYARERTGRSSMLIYAAAALWVFGLTLRALMTGAG